MYAVNLADLAHPDHDHGMVAFLIRPVRGETVQTARDRFDEMAIVLNCDDERALAIIELIRLKFKRNELRCYVGHSKTWKRV